MALLNRLALKLSCLLLASACAVPVADVKTCEQAPANADDACIEPAATPVATVRDVAPPRRAAPPPPPPY